MRFQILIAYRESAGVHINETLEDTLGKVLEDNLCEVDPQSIKDMIIAEHRRPGEISVDDSGAEWRHILLGFALDLPEELEQTEVVVEEFIDALGETPPVFHAVKFEDPLMRSRMVGWAEEMYALEMKLRRVLTFIYLHAYQDGDPCDLLQDETVQPMSKEKPEKRQMTKAAENQFFHLTFGQYVGLNQRPEIKLAELVSMIRDVDSFEEFRAEIERAPIGHEDDALLLAGLKERMEAIERMRNCIAHNRRPAERVINNYHNARPLLERMLDDYLARWEMGPR